MKYLLISLTRITVVLLLIGAPFLAAAEDTSRRVVDVYLFWEAGCPHCQREIEFLSQWQHQETRLRINRFEISLDSRSREIFMTMIHYFRIARPGVPLTVIGNRFFHGYNDDATTGAAIKTAVLACLETPCDDVVRAVLTGRTELEPREPPAPSAEVPRTVKLPFFGEITIAQVSLPLLTLMLAAVDGFNPCAMWTLLFLISLLVGLRDRFQMWVLGSAFILASALVYYLFMAAWLNLLFFLGMLALIRVSVGLLAVCGGGYYLHEYFVNPEAICRVTEPQARQRIFARLRSLTTERHFLLALGGIVLLAFAVNLVELICSAGIPAVYTQVLALSNLPSWQYHVYLGLYILVFMLDDLFVFFVAMQTLRVTGLTGAYVRHAHLAGGAVMILIGLMLLFKPQWLTFA